jgi:hypothetical protein
VQKGAFCLLVMISVPGLITAEVGSDNLSLAVADMNSDGREDSVSGVGFCGCDLVWDGFIDFHDFAILAAHWQADDCSVINGWCDGADITQDYSVDQQRPAGNGCFVLAGGGYRSSESGADAVGLQCGCERL